MPNWFWYVIGAVLGIGVAIVALRIGLRALRRTLLMRRYDDAEMVAVILSGQIAQGMTAEMVIDTWGKPADMDERVMKTKTKQETKYNQTGMNRFGTRVYHEDGVVVGWETK